MVASCYCRCVKRNSLFTIPGFSRYALRPTDQAPFADVVRLVGFGKRFPKGSSLRPTLLKIGYWSLHLVDDSGSKKGAYIHHLVMAALGSKKPAGHQIAHLDGDRQNNRIENLKWALPRENSSHRWQHGTSGTKLVAADVVNIRLAAESGDSISYLSRKYQVSRNLITRICNGDSWTTVGGPVCNKNRIRGEANVNSKLTESNVIQIRAMAQSGITRKSIAIMFGVAVITVNKIVNRQAWSHV